MRVDMRGRPKGSGAAPKEATRGQKRCKAYFAPACDFGSKEIAAWSVSRHPDIARQMGMLDMLIPKIPEGGNPIMQSDMGWQRQHDGYCGGLEAAGSPPTSTRSRASRRTILPIGTLEGGRSNLRD